VHLNLLKYLIRTHFCRLFSLLHSKKEEDILLLVHAEFFRPCSYSKLTSKAFPLHAKQAHR